MSEAYRITYYNVRISGNDTVADIIAALQQLPQHAEVDLTQTSFGKLTLRFDLPVNRDA